MSRPGSRNSIRSHSFKLFIAFCSYVVRQIVGQPFRNEKVCNRPISLSHRHTVVLSSSHSFPAIRLVNDNSSMNKSFQNNGFSNWNVGEPSINGQCAAMLTHLSQDWSRTTGWSMMPCERNLQFICATLSHPNDHCADVFV
jgi:hypothetical protein